MYLPSDNAASLVAWFRKGVGVTVTGAGVSLWADQSGNGRDLLQATDSFRPAYNAGTGVITFDGADNRLKCAAFTLNQPAQFSILFSQVSWSSADTVFDGDSANTQRLFQFVGSPTMQLFAGALGPTNNGAAVGSFAAVACVFNSLNSSIQVNANAAATGDAGSSNAGGFNLGCLSDNTVFANIAVKEVIIRNVADATIRAADQQYLIDLQSDVTPVAAFTGTPLTGTPGLSVAFTDQSTNTPREWLWDFGDGNTSILQNPTNVYAAAGTYTVTLTATNYAGADSEVKAAYITVSAPAVLTGGGGGARKFPTLAEDDRDRRDAKSIVMAAMSHWRQ